MTDSLIIEKLKAFIFPVLEETFEKVQGIYLDKGTSLLETLETVTAEEASRSLTPQTATIAAQVEHLLFYLDILDRIMAGEEVGKIDWKEIWLRRREIGAAEWDAMRIRLRQAYERMMTRTRAIETWDGENDIWGPMAIAIHTAYHLGGLRQALGAMR